MLFHCVSFTFLFISSNLLTVIALPAVTQTTTTTTKTDATNVKQVRELNEVNTIKLETPDHRQTTQLPAYSTVTISGDEDEEEESGYDEMVSYRSCQISDMTYRHREQIPRLDPCEICVCVDSEMYCLWKMCPSHQPPTPRTTSATNSIRSQTSKGTTKIVKMENDVGRRDVKMNEVRVKNEKFTEILTKERKFGALKNLETASPKNLTATKNVTEISTQSPAVSSAEPTVCYVMGVMYKLGEVLPRDTGTCLECACSEGARVTCRPKDCVSQPDLDYLSHSNNVDIFDLDSF